MKRLFTTTVFLLVAPMAMPVRSQIVNPPVIANPSVNSTTIAPSGTSTDALDINMPASTTGNSIAVKNSAGNTLFAVPGGGDVNHNSSQVASLASIPFDATNDAFFANMDVGGASGTIGNCFVCQDNSVTQGAISKKGEFFYSGTDTSTIPILVNAPSGLGASLMDLKVNGTHEFTVTQLGALAFGTLTSNVTGNPSIGLANVTGVLTPNVGGNGVAAYPGWTSSCSGTGVNAVTGNQLLIVPFTAVAPFSINSGIFGKLGTGDGSNNSDIGFYYCGTIGTGTCALIDDIGAQHISTTTATTWAYATNAGCTGSLAPGGLCTGSGTGTYPTLPTVEPPGYYVWAATNVTNTATFQFCNNSTADVGWFAKSTTYSSSSGGTLPASITAPSFAPVANARAFGMIY